MMIFRLLIGLLVAATVLCFALNLATGQPVWRLRAFLIMKWTVIAGLGFFAVLILERLALLL
ncbi:hypothetical protein LZ017_00505 [Pelomonas sp. CA6]|uniref:hypothetical protein n=1 Tax=Pelomonas sp. CA6 TaxID=2907999 RepID=UPI001F4A5631|nr:hypothetical protein [Pelomonas sp. CA6]MCH7341866.1 hypothetical protein [Pelomonas sp. CA6]